DGRDDHMTELLERYAPIIKLSGIEEYFPSSIEYMLSHYSFSLLFENEPRLRRKNHTILTPTHLDRFPRDGSGIFLSISEPHNPQPFLDDRSEYLYGPSRQESFRKRDEDGRERISEPVYAFWVDQKRGVVDLWYWTFYPFNYGKPVGPFGILGHHVADWERFTVRTINGTAVSADYSDHRGGRFSAGTVRWEDVTQVEGRPVAYAAAGSHGIWPGPGEHLKNLFKLVDSTDDEGAIWDTKGHVVPLRWWSGPETKEKIIHKHQLHWLNFRGYWGNKGERDCWWHNLIDICQLVDAPPGPNRRFNEPPACIIAPLSTESSSYFFYLSSTAAHWAELRDVATIKVDQICVRPTNNGDDDDDLDRFLNQDMDIRAVSGTTSFLGLEQHFVTIQPCQGTRSAVKAYRLSLCLQNGKCISTSPERKVCSYEPGKAGYKIASAVSVDDVDDWGWSM
ncbi:hypothetical protein TREMEDRAFT_33600, partial [Tremella mesenterica DSM 1558]|uniref:uncharacterized protein n=1 Tax=Tremella mesenterica (strain ATCC 24925 / CBS 8224 / DSM 1558 / NBRC 9311 / NRRL Y-6157 / RJB 2259-6 / UBC 559-6) TaxID=578456 RepID=UPI0003F49CE6